MNSFFARLPFFDVPMLSMLQSEEQEKTMQIQIPPEQETMIKSLAINAGFASVDQYVFSLIARDNERSAIQLGLDQVAAGNVRSFETFDAEFRKRKGIPTGS